MIGTLTAAALASLVGTPHCLGMCGGFAAAAGRTPGELIAWHAGKLGTYVALGMVVGAVGDVLPVPAEAMAVIGGIFLLWFGLAIAGLVPEPKVMLPGLSRLGVKAAGRSGIPARLLFGIVNGLLPCGLLYAALGMAMSTGSWWQGGLVLLVFGLGTVPGLTAAAYGLRVLLNRYRWTRYVLAVVVIVSGGLGIAWRFLPVSWP